MMVICDVKFDIKYDQIIQNSSQEPSTYSKDDWVCQETGREGLFLGVWPQSAFLV